MGESSKPGGPAGGGRDPALAQLMDPVAWEARVSEARARRAAVLARREGARDAGAPRKVLAPARPADPAPPRAAADRPAPPPDAIAAFAADRTTEVATDGATGAAAADPAGARPAVGAAEGPPGLAGPADRARAMMRRHASRALAILRRSAAALAGSGNRRLAGLFVAGLLLGAAAAIALSAVVLDRTGAAVPILPDSALPDARAAVGPLPPGAADWVPATAPDFELALSPEESPATLGVSGLGIAIVAETPPADPEPAHLAAYSGAPLATGAGEAPGHGGAGQAAGGTALVGRPGGTDGPIADLDAAEAALSRLAPGTSAEEPLGAPAQADATSAPVEDDAIPPTGPAGRPMPRPADHVAGPAPDAGDAADPGAPAALALARVIVNLPSRAPEARAEEVIAALAAAGVEPQGRARVPVTIATPNIRFYHPADAAAARSLAATIEAATGTAIAARDFTGHRPRPREGTVEIWLAGEGGPARQPVRTTPRGATSLDQFTNQAARDLEALAQEIARGIARTLGN